MVEQIKAFSAPSLTGFGRVRAARRLVISIDDVSPCFLSGVRELLEHLPKASHLVVGIVPNYMGLYPIDKEPAVLDCFDDFTVEWAMHGYTHTVRSARGGEDFEFKSLSYDKAKRRIEYGKDLLKAVGIAPKNFVPPGLKTSRDAIKAVKEEFDITSDLYRIIDLSSRRRFKIPCISLNWGRSQLEDYLICYSGMMVAHLGMLRRADLRLLTHVQSLITVKQVASLITRILQQGYRSVTHAELLEAMPEKESYQIGNRAKAQGHPKPGRGIHPQIGSKN